MTEPRTVTVETSRNVPAARVRELATIVSHRVGPLAAALLTDLARGMEAPLYPRFDDPDVIHVRLPHGGKYYTRHTIDALRRLSGEEDSSEPGPGPRSVLLAVADAMEAQRPQPIEPGVYLALFAQEDDPLFAEFKNDRWYAADGSVFPWPTDRRQFSVLEKIGERNRD